MRVARMALVSQNEFTPYFIEHRTGGGGGGGGGRDVMEVLAPQCFLVYATDK